MQVGAACRRFSVGVLIGLVAVTVGAASAPSSVSAAGFSCSSDPSYEVRSGDSWYGIAEQVDVGVQALVDANDASIRSLLRPGDHVCLPGGADLSGACNSYTVSSGDSWASIGSRAGSSASAVAQANGVRTSATIHPGDTICLPSGTSLSSGSSTSAGSSGGSNSGGGSYMVARGDSWAAIASRAGVSMRSLLSANGASSSDLLLPGDLLRLPAGASLALASSVRMDAAPTQGPCGYSDTWGQARSGGRSHQGTDIFPGWGNYVYAVADGKLTSRIWDGAGRNAGNAWSLTGDDGTRYFYAHLSDFAPGLQVGSSVRAGQIIGWVGTTGNASAAHLHFEIRPGGGSPVNPYPILRAQGGCNGATPYTQPSGWIPNRIT